jgi:hypothetical protein
MNKPSDKKCVICRAASAVAVMVAKRDENAQFEVCGPCAMPFEGKVYFKKIKGE